MNMKTICYVNTYTDIINALHDKLKQRAETLRHAGHNKTEQAKNQRAAIELELEAEWLKRVEFRPRSENPFT